MEIFGLNVPPAANLNLSTSALPSHVVMVVALLRTSASDIIQPEWRSDACQKITPITLDCTARFQACHVEPLYVPHFMHEAELFDSVGLHPLQEKWSLGDVFLTAGFFDPDRITEPPVLALHTGVTVQNLVIANADSIDPRMHTGVDVSQEVEKYFRSTVGNLFASRQCVWNQALLTLENEVLVKSWSKLQGDDPDQEWAKFQAAGFDHHLQYMTICNS